MSDLVLSLLAAGDNPLEHVIDKKLVGTDGFWAISNATLMLVVSGVVITLALILAAKRIKTGESRSIDDFRTQGIWANLVETICVYLRNEIFRPNLGKDTDKYAPILWTLFFFILTCNLFGLVPLKDLTGGLLGLNHGHGFGGTATQSIWVTGALALIAFVLINVTAIVKDPKGYAMHLTGGTPVYMWPLMVPLEILGTFIKPFALAMRLFANMTGGHVVVAVMLMFIKMLVDNLGGLGYAMGVLPFLAMIGIYFLEVIVAFIQAFVFVFLTAVFMGLLMHHHDHEHDHGDGHGEHVHSDDIQENRDPKIDNMRAAV